MGSPISALIGLTGSVVLIGIGLKPTKMKLPRLKI